jgi:hypothetical protein
MRRGLCGRTALAYQGDLATDTVIAAQLFEAAGAAFDIICTQRLRANRNHDDTWFGTGLCRDEPAFGTTHADGRSTQYEMAASDLDGQASRGVALIQESLHGWHDGPATTTYPRGAWLGHARQCATGRAPVRSARLDISVN